MTTTSTDLLSPFFSSLDALGERDALIALEACRRRCDGAEATILAARIDPSTGDDRAAKRLLQTVGGTSRRDRARRAKRAAVVADAPQLAEKLSTGAASGEVLDLLADANRLSAGDAVRDRDLVDRIVDAGPDLGRRVKDRWLNDRKTREGVEAEYRRQREARSAWRHRTESGLAAITMAGDDATIDTLWARIETAADCAYKQDGGRNTAGHKHRRSHQQRCFDAAAEVFGGDERLSSRGGRPAVVITVDANRLFDSSGDTPLAEQVGTGPIADKVVIEALKTADLYTLVGEPRGQPLWLGRSARSPNRAQLIAAICRDKGCIATGESWHRCEIHHTIPWNSCAQGPTDIDNLVLVSQETHRATHSQNLKWSYDPIVGKWVSSQAPPSEHAPQRQGRPR